MYEKLVLSGGSIKGFGTIGCLQKLYENKLLDNITHYCGTSVGAIISLLLLIGYLPSKIFLILCEINFETLIHENIDDILINPLIGLYSVKPIMFVIGMLLKDKKIPFKITFKQLFEKFKKHLIVTGVCLNNNTLVFFDKEKYPDMEVLKAIQISISIPIFFKPTEYDNKIWIDGGCLNNYPIDYFNDDLNNIIGINLLSNVTIIEQFNTHEEYLKQLLSCLKILANKNNTLYDKFTINLYFENAEHTFDINNEFKLFLYNIGYNTSIDKFL